MYMHRLECCGVLEIDGLSDHKNAKDAMMEAVACAEELPKGYSYREHSLYYGDFDQSEGCGHYGIIMFSAASRSTYGDNFRRFIAEHSLGTVIHTPWVLNKNSGNDIKVYLWEVDHKALIKWGLENQVWVAKAEPEKPVARIPPTPSSTAPQPTSRT